MKVWKKITLSFCFIFISLILISFLKTFSISPTGQFILTIGSGIGLVTGVAIFFSFLIQVVKSKVPLTQEKPEMPYSKEFEECETMLYRLNKIAGKDKELTPTDVYEIKGVFNRYVKGILKGHKEFTSYLYQTHHKLHDTLQDIYHSMKGHGKFSNERALDLALDLRYELGELVYGHKKEGRGL